MTGTGIIAIAAAIAAFTGIGAGIGIGLATGKAVEAIAIYGLVVALVLVFLKMG
jgi:F-type H+-transporting ATPase subunit c